MTEYCVKYSTVTGLELVRCHGPEGVAKLQFVGTGEALITISAAAFQLPLTDIPIPDLQASLWAQVKAKRDAVIDGGAPTPFGAVDSYELARSNIAGAAMAALIAKGAAQPYSINWTLLDNSVVALDADAMMAVSLAVLAHVNAAHDRARDLRATIDAAGDVSALLRIDIASGWPE